jgi:protein-disulfide isomerase
VVVAFLAGMFLTKLKNLEKKESEKAAQTTPSPQNAKQPEAIGMVLGKAEIAKIESGGAGIRGEENAPITIVEFSEYQCPFCGKYVEDAYAEIWKEYEDKIRYIFRDYPLGFHSHAQKLAEAARCAGDQGQYWEMHDLVFAKSEEWTNKEDISSNLNNYLNELGLDKNGFNNCLESGKYTQAVKDDFQLGTEIGVNGTPTFFINGQKLVGAQPFSKFKEIIDAELAK